MEKIQLWWMLGRVKSVGRCWEHEDAMSCGALRVLEISDGFGDNWWVKGHVAPVLGTDTDSVGALWSNSSCSFLSTSCFYFFKWINTPVLKYLM